MRPLTFVLACATTAIIQFSPGAAAAAGREGAPLAISSARVSLDGTSNIHAFTAATTNVRLTGLEVEDAPGADLLTHILQPGNLKTLEIAIPAKTLTSPKDGIDKNMHKALKTDVHPDITFRLRHIEAAGAAYRAVGWVSIAGVEREITLSLQIDRKDGVLAVAGTTDLLMTDFGITPPKAMLGMLKTNPKVQIRIDLLLSAL